MGLMKMLELRTLLETLRRSDSKRVCTTLWHEHGHDDDDDDGSETHLLSLLAPWSRSSSTRVAGVCV